MYCVDPPLARGLCREQWSCGGTGVGVAAQFWLTVSQYVEWGSMRCGLLVLFLFLLLLRWFLRCLFFLLLPQEKRERKENPCQASTTPKKENASQVPLTFNINSSLWFMSQHDLSLLSITPSTNMKKKKYKSFDKPLWHEEHLEEGWAICSEKWFIKERWVTMSHPAFALLLFPPQSHCCPRCSFIKIRGLVRRVTLGHSFLWLMQSRLLSEYAQTTHAHDRMLLQDRNFFLD